MTIELKTGDILAEDAAALVNTVNCVGVMGRGIALQFKKAWPENFKAYAEACARHEVKPGRPFIFETGRLTNPLYIINFPTKRHWRAKARLDDIELGLEALKKEIRRLSIESIAIPPLGSGLGGLNWAEVRPRIEKALSEMDGLRVVLFEPGPEPVTTARSRGRKPPAMTSGRAAIVGLLDRYLRGLLDPFVSLIELHKLMYFMQETGEPLRLKVKKGLYGPYAENLRHVLNQIEGFFITGYGAGGDDPSKLLDLLPGAREAARATLSENPETERRLKRVDDLVEGFESPFGLELLATVHWIVTREGETSDSALVEKTYAWNPRKKRFSKDQILLARDVLVERSWLDQAPT